MRPVAFAPATPEQRKARKAFATSDILFLIGEAGSGKTHTAIGLAATEVMEQRATRIYLSRPVVPSGGEQLGFLPGKLEQKMHPWLLPVHDVLRRLTFEKPDEFIKNTCEVAPIAYLRGRTFDRGVAILDEAQNATREQLILFLTRIGPKAKLIITGDLSQTDRKDGGLGYVVDRLTSCPLPSVSVVNLTGDVNPRHHLIPQLLDVLS